MEPHEQITFPITLWDDLDASRDEDMDIDPETLPALILVLRKCGICRKVGHTRSMCVENICSICQDPMTANTMQRLSGCIHKFHRECILHWNMLNRTDCPNCRTPFDSIVNDVIVSGTLTMNLGREIELEFDYCERTGAVGFDMTTGRTIEEVRRAIYTVRSLLARMEEYGVNEHQV